MKITLNKIQAFLFVIITSIAITSIINQQQYSVVNPIPTYSVVTAPLAEVNYIKELPLPVSVKKESVITTYLDLTIPKGIGHVKYYHDLFNEVANLVDVDVNILLKFAAIESSFDPKAFVKSTGASGLFQFIPGTWEDVVKKHGKQYGIDDKTSVFDPRANALMAGFHLQSNIKLLKDKTGKQNIKTADVYLTHLLGRTGSLRYLKIPETGKPALHMTRAANNNRLFFYNDKKVLTKKESYLTINTHIQNKAKEFGIVL